MTMFRTKLWKKCWDLGRSGQPKTKTTVVHHARRCSRIARWGGSIDSIWTEEEALIESLTKCDININWDGCAGTHHFLSSTPSYGAEGAPKTVLSASCAFPSNACRPPASYSPPFQSPLADTILPFQPWCLYSWRDYWAIGQKDPCQIRSIPHSRGFSDPKGSNRSFALVYSWQLVENSLCFPQTWEPCWLFLRWKWRVPSIRDSSGWPACFRWNVCCRSLHSL